VNPEIYADSFEYGMNLVGVGFPKTAAQGQPTVVAVPTFPGVYPGMQLMTLPVGQEEKKKSSGNAALRYLPVLALVALGLIFGPRLWSWLTGGEKSYGQPQRKVPQPADFSKHLLPEHEQELAKILAPMAKSVTAAQGFRAFADEYARLFG
jgi:hypothetical protein